MSTQTNPAQADTSDCASVLSSGTSRTSTMDSFTNIDSPQKQANPHHHQEPHITASFTPKSQVYWRCFVALSTITVMFVAKANVPDNPVTGIEDRVMNAFQSLNAWILLEENEIYRSAFLFMCGSQIDLIFFSTLLYWVLYGKTGRLPVSSAIFYAVRAAVQAAFWTPYPEGYNWDSPGFPSFVAPYGKGSDFFFSGHSGFLVLMANEWNMNGYVKMRNYCLLNLVYTVFVLLIYQAHYSIDIFTGVFFADYVFGKVDYYKEKIDGFWKRFALNVESIAVRTKSKISGIRGTVKLSGKKK